MSKKEPLIPGGGHVDPRHESGRMPAKQLKESMTPPIERVEQEKAAIAEHLKERGGQIHSKVEAISFDVERTVSEIMAFLTIPESVKKEWKSLSQGGHEQRRAAWQSESEWKRKAAIIAEEVSRLQAVYTKTLEQSKGIDRELTRLGQEQAAFKPSVKTSQTPLSKPTKNKESFADMVKRVQKAAEPEKPTAARPSETIADLKEKKRSTLTRLIENVRAWQQITDQFKTAGDESRQQSIHELAEELDQSVTAAEKQSAEESADLFSLAEEGEKMTKETEFGELEVAKAWEINHVKALGTGAFGMVYEAKLVMDGEEQEVVLKVSQKPEHIKKLLAEIEIATVIPTEIKDRIIAPHKAFVVSGYFHGLPEGTIFTVQEKAPGGHPLQFLQGKEAKDRRQSATDMMVGLAEAVDTLHQKGHIVHRDIKPDNLLIDERKAVHLFDFGEARDLNNLPDHQLDLAGSPKYLPPEACQLILNAKFYREEVSLEQMKLIMTPQIDIYALGVTCYELLTGENPYAELTEEKLYKLKLDRENDPMLEKNVTKKLQEKLRNDSKDPASLAKIIAKATARDPADRYRNAGEFAEALRNNLKQGDSRGFRKITNAFGKLLG